MSYPHRRTYVDPPGAYKCAECGYTTTDRGGNPASVGFGENCPAAMRERIAGLERTIAALRTTLDRIAAVGWDAACDGDNEALAPEDCYRMSRYAVRVARELRGARARIGELEHEADRLSAVVTTMLGRRS